MAKNKTLSKEELEAYLDEPLLHWKTKEKDTHKATIARMLQGTQIFGGTGSGKSSGSGAAIAMAFLEAGFGGLVLCAKPGEAEVWRKYIKKSKNRSEDDLVVFNKKSGKRFNPILYEDLRGGEGAGETLNLVELLMNIHQIGQNYMSGGGGSSSEPFWDQALKRCIARSIDLLKLAAFPVTVPDMREIIVSSPQHGAVEEYRKLMQKEEQLREELGTVPKIMDAGERVAKRESINKERLENIDAIRQLTDESYCLRALVSAEERHFSGALSEGDMVTYNLVRNYFLREFAYLSERTRTSIEEYFFGLVEPFTSKGLLREVFNQDTSPELLPEETYRGNKIIILDFPVKEWLVSGIYAQAMYKYMWQQAMERRDPLKSEHQTPVFLWVDEAQYFINPNHDALFQTTARSSLVCTVYLTQSINNYYFAMGSRSPEARAKALLANMGTKIFHANTDFDTNEYATKMIGKISGKNRTDPVQKDGTGKSTLSDHLVDPVPSSDFVKLAFGRKENDGEVEAIIIQTGGRWDDTDDSYIRAVFKQG